MKVLKSVSFINITIMAYALVRQLRRATWLSHQIRLETTMTSPTQEAYLIRPPFPHWSKVISEAEKVVGYPTSFLNLRLLLSDEFANMAIHLRKLAGSNHPLIQIAKTVLYNEQNNLQPWGLVILLLSKAIRPTHLDSSFHSNTVNEKQRTLAEITELMRTGHYVHRGILNIPQEELGKRTETEAFANNVAMLLGDYLLVVANSMLAKLRNQDLSYLMSTAIRDTSDGEFFGDRDEQNLPLPGKPSQSGSDEYHICPDTLPLVTEDMLGCPVKEWTLRSLYGGGLLFGRGCQGALLLADQDLIQQEKAYQFGCHLCLAWQSASELQKFSKNNNESFSVVSAPVLFALNENPDLYKVIKASKENVGDIDLIFLKEEVLRTGALERTKSLQVEHAEKAKYFIEMFGDNESVQAIKRLIHTI